MTQLLSVCWLFFTGVILLGTPPRSVQYTILPESVLVLDGTSNVRSFSCECAEYTKRGDLAILEKSTTTMSLHGAELQLRVRSFDCGHKGINKDMAEALGAEQHPYIQIALREADLANGLQMINAKQPLPMRVKTAITIAGATRHIELDVVMTQTGTDTYRLVSKKTVCMSDFGVEPPTPFFGLIVVHDAISIRFDLVVRVAG
jgi:hypothetical protein